MSIFIKSPWNYVDRYRDGAPATIQAMDNNSDMPEVVDNTKIPEAIDNNIDIPEDMDDNFDIPEGSSTSTSPKTAPAHFQDRKKERIKVRRARKLARRYERITLPLAIWIIETL